MAGAWRRTHASCRPITHSRATMTLRRARRYAGCITGWWWVTTGTGKRGRPRGRANRKIACTCKRCGQTFMSGWATAMWCSSRCRNAAITERHASWERQCGWCGTTFTTRYERQQWCSTRCRERQRSRTAVRQAHSRNQQARRHRAKGRLSDLTASDVAQVMASRTYCPLCKRRMVVGHGSPRSKQLDHVIPLAVGGTHTLGNVRVICRDCNLRRPKDGSDVVGQVPLWGVVDTP